MKAAKIAEAFYMLSNAFESLATASEAFAEAFDDVDTTPFTRDEEAAILAKCEARALEDLKAQEVALMAEGPDPFFDDAKDPEPTEPPWVPTVDDLRDVLSTAVERGVDRKTIREGMIKVIGKSVPVHAMNDGDRAAMFAFVHKMYKEGEVNG